MRVSLPSLCLCVACGGEAGLVDDSAPPARAPRTAAVLADMAAWAEGGVDPMPEHAAPESTCPPSGWGLEGAALEVSTGVCTHAVLEQPLLADLMPGDRVEVVWWHNQLVAESPATGHLLLAVDGETLYEREVAIPSDADAYTEQVEITRAVVAGAPLVLHLHNHGANDWTLLRIERLASDAPPAQ